jgi:hypothetical protein
MSYAKSALSISLENIETAIIPTYSDWIDDGTKSVQVPDADEARAMWQRIIFGQPISIYNVEYTGGFENIPGSLGSNQSYAFDLTIKNTGVSTWTKTGDNPYYLSYHWLDFETKKAVVFDGERTYLPVDSVEPGQDIDVNVKIVTPAEPGNYILQIDMVHEGVTWFSYQGVPPLEKYISVNVVYAAIYNDDDMTPKQVKPGETFTTKISVKNNGFSTWESEGDERVDLSYHWYNRDTREVVIFEGNRANIPYDIERNQSAQIELSVIAPKEPGRYILAYDLVHERVTWFSQAGVFPLEVNVDVGIVVDNAIARKTSVVIYNGCGIIGAATEFKNYLKNYSFKINDLANAPSYDFEKTVIIYREGREENAGQLSRTLTSFTIEPYSNKWKDYSTSADLIVIIGSDYAENISWQK